MKKYGILTILGIMILVGCTDNELELPTDSNGTSTLNMQISSLGFGDSNRTNRAARSSSTNITWDHVFGGTGTIVFTNTSTVTPIDSTYTLDMGDFATNGLSKTLINGDYDVNLTMDDTTPVPYVPVSATDDFSLSNDSDLVLNANTTYGMVLLNPYLVDTSVTPIFSTGGTDYALVQDQGYYFLYAPDGITGTITIQESLFGQTVSKEITIASTTIDALELAPVTSSAGVSLILEEFTVEFDQWNIDAPIGGITPSFGLFTDSGQALGSSDSHDVSLGDLDGDGDLDAFVINRTQPSKIWMNDGNANFTDSGQSISITESISLSLGDLDGDGDLDAFIANYNNQPNNIWINDGNGFFIDSGQSLGNSNSNSVVLDDLDNDGDLDAFVANTSGEPNKIWYNDGSGIFTDSGQLIGNLSSRSVTLGDLDGDGDLDVIIGNWDRPNEVWLNDGNGVFTDSGQSFGNINSGSKEISLGDVDNDGDLDACVAEYLESNPLWLNNGSGVFTDSGQSLSGDQSTDLSLKDLDGDGDLDAFVVYFDRPNKVWLNDGNGNFTDSGQSLGNSYSDGISVGDLDGDGDLDAFVIEHSQPNKVWINN